MNRLKLLLAAMLLVCASDVSAGIAVPELLSTDPVEPRANQQFDLIYTLQFCGAGFPAYTPQNRAVEIVGGAIRVTVLYAGEICFPSQPYIPTYRWRVGPLASGSYHMELRGYNAESGPQNSFPIASGEVTILPAIVAPKPNVVPAAGTLGLLCMSVLTVLAAMWGLRRR